MFCLGTQLLMLLRLEQAPTGSHNDNDSTNAKTTAELEALRSQVARLQDNMDSLLRDRWNIDNSQQASKRQEQAKYRKNKYQTMHAPHVAHTHTHTHTHTPGVVVEIVP